MLKKKIVANLNPDGQQPWVQRINKYNIMHTENRSKLKTRIKTSFFKMKPTEFFFEKSRCSMLPFKTLEEAFENIDKVTFFCTNLHICAKKQTNEIDRLEKRTNKLEKGINKVITGLKDAAKKSGEKEGIISTDIEKHVNNLSFLLEEEERVSDESDD